MHVSPRDSVECGYLNHLVEKDVNSVGAAYWWGDDRRLTRHGGHNAGFAVALDLVRALRPVRLPGTAYLFSHAGVGGLGDRDVGQVQSEAASLTVILGDSLAVATDTLTVWMCSDPAWVTFGENVDLDTVGTVAATVTRDAADLARTDDGRAVAECSLEANLSDWVRRARVRSWVRPWGCDRSLGSAEALLLHGAR